MNSLKILIVDDMDVNRLLLTSICQQIDDIEIKESCNGIDAIETVEAWHPHIVLMDIMMPRMDGFEASKIIKERYPEIMIIAVTAMNDSQMEKNMASIGVVIYIHKPFDKDLIRFKLESFGALFRAKEGSFKSLPKSKALNPFSSDIRRIKTTFDIIDSDSTMDFGMWILSKVAISCYRIDMALEFFYALIREYSYQTNALHVVIEESFDEIFVTIECEKAFDFQHDMLSLAYKLGDMCVIDQKAVYVRLPLQDHCIIPTHHAKIPDKPKLPAAVTQPVIAPIKTKIEYIEPVIASVPLKETRVVIGQEKDLLRQSFTQKTSAREYVQDIGGDVLDEIRDLSSSDHEWKEHLSTLDHEATIENLYHFSDSVLGTYIHAINALFEFTALGYALSALSVSIKEHAVEIISDSKRLKTLLMLLEHLGEDLSSWREHIFIAQDTADIHYLDSSFFSSCMQIEGIISNKQISAHEDEDDEMEFF